MKRFVSHVIYVNFDFYCGAILFLISWTCLTLIFFDWNLHNERLSCKFLQSLNPLRLCVLSKFPVACGDELLAESGTSAVYTLSFSVNSGVKKLSSTIESTCPLRSPISGRLNDASEEIPFTAAFIHVSDFDHSSESPNLKSSAVSRPNTSITVVSRNQTGASKAPVWFTDSIPRRWLSRRWGIKSPGTNLWSS